MITLYHCMSARSFRPLWMLEELGLPYALKMLPFPPRAQARQFLEVNPLGTVPALFDGELLMTESSAICEYLAVKFGPTALGVSADEPDFGRYLNWLHFGEATLTFPQTIILRYGQFEEASRRLPQAVDDYSRWFLGRLRAVESALDTREYLCQDRFTAADVSVGYAIMLAAFIGLEGSFTGNIRSYWARLQAREGFCKALQAQEYAAIEQNVSVVHAPLIGR